MSAIFYQTACASYYEKDIFVFLINIYTLLNANCLSDKWRRLHVGSCLRPMRFAFVTIFQRCYINNGRIGSGAYLWHSSWGVRDGGKTRVWVVWVRARGNGGACHQGPTRGENKYATIIKS